jgi:hypothetical protein
MSQEAKMSYGGYVDWRYFPGPWQTDGLPNDPAADSMEAMQERDEREWDVAGMVWAGTVTRADVHRYPFVVLHALQAAKPTLTWIKCSAFYVRLLADGEDLPGGATLQAALCEYLGV